MAFGRTRQLRGDRAAADHRAGCGQLPGQHQDGAAAPRPPPAGGSALGWSVADFDLAVWKRSSRARVRRRCPRIGHLWPAISIDFADRRQRWRRLDEMSVTAGRSSMITQKGINDHDRRAGRAVGRHRSACRTAPRRANFGPKRSLRRPLRTGPIAGAEG